MNRLVLYNNFATHTFLLLKAYDISRSQLDAEYSDSCSQVHSSKKEYRHLLQVTEGAKRKLEKSMQRSNAKKEKENDK